MLGDREFTTEEIAQICGVSRPAVVDWITRGTLRARVTDGGHRRVARATLAEFLRAQSYRVPTSVARERPLVFVLDDEAIWRQSIETALEHDFEVVACAPGPEALLAIGEQRPDAVIVDLHMPGVDAPLLVEALSEAQELLGEVLVVAVAAHDEDLPIARRRGAHLALSKGRVAAGELQPLLVKLVSEHQRRPLLRP